MGDQPPPDYDGVHPQVQNYPQQGNPQQGCPQQQYVLNQVRNCQIIIYIIGKGHYKRPKFEFHCPP